MSLRELGPHGCTRQTRAQHGPAAQAVDGGVRGQGEVQGGGAVDELLVGLSKRGQAKGKEKQRTKIRFPHALARHSILFPMISFM